MSDKLILVTGTTSDYIDIIWRRYPDRVIFLTDDAERAKASEPPVPAPREVLGDLTRHDEIIAKLKKHLDKWNIRLSGITCFDCESLGLAARIAGAMSLSYISHEAVLACRNKYASKEKWRAAGLPCPEARIVKNISEAMSFLAKIQQPVVIKPLAGSGSEYVFSCSNEEECRAAFATLEAKLAELRNNPDKPLYSRDQSPALSPGAYVIEEFIQGVEYSCDFVIDGDRLEIIRIARKIPARDLSFGTTLAYVVPADMPASFDMKRFHVQLKNAAHALGVKRAICMLDFIIRNGQAFMIEMTPRPGGDCLPPLIMKSSGLDTLGLAVDFAGGIFPVIPERSKWKQLVGFRFFAGQAGIIKEFDTRALLRDKRVIDCSIKYQPGHEVIMPPEDYDSRLLGHVIFEPLNHDAIEKECEEINQLFKIRMETP